LIEKLKKQLFKQSLPLLIALFVVLIGLNILFVFLNPHFLYVLALGLLVVVIQLIPLHQKVSHKHSEVELQIQSLEEQKNLIEADIAHEEQAVKSFQEKIIDSSLLKDLTEKLSRCLSLEDATRTLSLEVNRLFSDREATIILYLFHSKTGELGLSSSQKGQMRVNIKSKQGDIFDQWLVRTMQPLLIEDVLSDYRFDVDKIATEYPRPLSSLISVPLMVGNKAMGILRVDSTREKAFGTDDLRFLTTIGDLGAVAIENAQLYETIEQLAIKDGLTDLYLRRYLFERLPAEISRQLRRKATLSLLMMDLDKFKEYNDKYGHAAGDIVLRSLALLSKHFFKDPGTLICRYGGEEFCVLLLDCPKKRAVELAEEFRKRIESQTIELRRQKTNITVSIGVASLPEDTTMKEELISKADQAMYKAKSKGRNQVCEA
jgi:diguanylate cyclase (GGDEF)-like protein